MIRKDDKERERKKKGFTKLWKAWRSNGFYTFEETNKWEKKLKKKKKTHTQGKMAQ